MHLNTILHDYDDEQHHFEICLLYDDVEVDEHVQRYAMHIVVHDAVDELWRDYDQIECDDDEHELCEIDEIDNIVVPLITTDEHDERDILINIHENVFDDDEVVLHVEAE